MSLQSASDNADQLTPTSDSSNSSSILLATAQSIQLGTLTKRFEMKLDEGEEEGEVITPEPDDDDDDEVVDDEEDEEEDLDPDTLDLLENMTDPELVKQMLSNIQARFKNFEDILVDVRMQLVDIHERDDDIVKRIALLNEEISELNLLESFDTASRSTTGVAGAGDSFADNFSDYGTEPTGALPTKSQQSPFPK